MQHQSTIQKPFKPLNLIFFDAYIMFIIYLAINWQSVGCSTNSNIWQIFYYVLLLLRLGIDELQNKEVISRTCYFITIFASSLLLVGMCAYQMWAIFDNPDAFSVETDEEPCFSNRILLVGQCVLGFAIFVKDIVVAICCRAEIQPEQQTNE